MLLVFYVMAMAIALPAAEMTEEVRRGDDLYYYYSERDFIGQAPPRPIRPCTIRTCGGEVSRAGCYHDNAIHRAMNALNYTDSGAMTQEACFAFCAGQTPPFRYAGVEDADQCFCGNTLPSPSASAHHLGSTSTGSTKGSTGSSIAPPVAPPPVPTYCSAPKPHAPCQPYKTCKGGKNSSELCCCSGNSSEACGGVGLLQIFDVSHYRCRDRPIDAPYCNSSMPAAARAADLLTHMLPQEKFNCLSNHNCHLPRLGISIVWAESLHGLRRNCVRDVQGRDTAMCPTSFPHAQLLAASFNRTLWDAVGTGIGVETRAWYNTYLSGRAPSLMGSPPATSFWAPDINLCRDPRWGRCLEVPGEDPFLTGAYAQHYVRGLQTREEKKLEERKEKTGEGEREGFFTMGLANAKHWSVYNVETGATNDGTGDRYSRFSFNSYVTRRDLTETYFQQFRAAAGAGLSGAMCSYNAVCTPGIKGGACVPSCANDVFNNDVLRKRLNLTDAGMIVSDCSAIAGIGPAGHSYVPAGQETAAGLRGGTDLDCGTVYTTQAAAALANGTVNSADITRSLTRVLSQAFRTGGGEVEPPFSHISDKDVDSPALRQVALDGARQGFVLLSNKNGTLPLTTSAARTGGGSSGGGGLGDGSDGVGGSATRPLRVAVLGPHYNSSIHLLANYYGENDLVYSSTPVLGLQRRPELDVIGSMAGVDLINVSAPTHIDEAADLAKSAEVAVVFIGLHSTQGPQVHNGPGMEREGYDRTNLTLPGGQEALVRAIVATGTTTVVVLINSGGLAAPWVYEHADAVLEAYYPGELGGDAMASVLLGDVSPAGRLTTTIYPADFVERRNITDMVMRPHGNVPGLTHRFIPTSDVLFPFGYGRSYTTFKFEWGAEGAASESAAVLASLTTQQLATAIPLAAALEPTGLPALNVKVTNTGRTRSDVVVICFASSTLQGDNAPLRQLLAFERLSNVRPGSSTTAALSILPAALTTVDDNGNEMAGPAEFSVRCGGDPDGWSDAVKLQISGSAVSVFELPRDS